MLTQKPYQPLSIPSVTWALTSQLAPSVFTGQYRGDMNMNFRAGLFSSAFSAFSAPVARQDVTSESRSAARSWVEPHNSEDESFY
nr:hypothetical protein BaRGS_023983 [Batillaria attramentaria]